MTDPQSSTVTVPVGGGETEQTDIPTAVEVNRRMLMEPGDFGIAPEEEVTSLHQAVADLYEQNDSRRERIDQLENAVEMLAAESSVMGGECPDCGSEMSVKDGGFGGNRRVECEGCGRTATPNGMVR